MVVLENIPSYLFRRGGKKKVEEGVTIKFIVSRVIHEAEKFCVFGQLSEL